MPAANIAVIYADNSKVIRRVIVSDTDEELQRAIAVVAGEKVLLVPFPEYKQFNDAHFRAFVASQIGEAGPDKCAEVAPHGLVTAVYRGDPLLDRPFNPQNTVELNEKADVGDVKMQGTGEFVSMKYIDTSAAARQSRIDAIMSMDLGETLEEVTAAVDAEIAVHNQYKQKQAQAAAQAGVPIPVAPGEVVIVP